MGSALRNALLRSALKRVLAFALSAVAGPLTYADATALLDIAEAGAIACQERGVFCRWGANGAVDGRKVCIPAKWSAENWYVHGQICRHCPIFKRARKDV